MDTAIIAPARDAPPRPRRARPFTPVAPSAMLPPMPDGLERIAHPLAGSLTAPWRASFQALYLADLRSHVVAEHLHHDLELFLVQRGVWRGSIDGRPVAARAPSVLAVHPGQRHADACDTPLRFVVLQAAMLPREVPGRSARIVVDGADPVMPLDGALLREFAALADAMAMAGRARSAASAPVLDALAGAFVWSWAGHLPPGALVPEAGTYVEASAFAVRLHATFARHERRHLGLAALAAAMGMTPRTLSWRCRRHFRASPARLFQRHRLATAWDCLRSTRLGVAEVAERYGYASAAHFSTAFRRCFGMPPRVARRA